jgi:hypothetical protein
LNQHPKKTEIVDENDSLELKEHPIFVQGFFNNKTSSPVPDLVLQILNWV